MDFRYSLVSIEYFIGIIYHDFEQSSISQQSGPGPSSASISSLHRMQPGGTLPKPPNKPGKCKQILFSLI